MAATVTHTHTHTHTHTLVLQGHHPCRVQRRVSVDFLFLSLLLALVSHSLFFLNVLNDGN